MNTDERKEEPKKVPPGTPDRTPMKEPNQDKETRQVTPTPSSDEASYYKDEQTEMGGEEHGSDDLSDQQDKTRKH
jgi:hypothetical protein